MYRHVVLGLVLLAATLSACQTDEEPPASQSTATPSDGEQIGGTVSVLASWGGDEQESFLAMVEPFEERTGVQVQYEGTRDLAAVLTTRVQGGNPPDVAGLPGPGQMIEFARDDKLIDLTGALDMEQMREDYSEDWIELAQVDGKQVGIFIKAALKGLVWYNPQAFEAAGYETPENWDELTSLSEQIVSTGTTPWCIGLESGPASGWPGTDWLENILLRQSGPDAYDRWARGELKWTSAEVREAWETFGQIVSDPNMVYGGRQGMLATNFGDAGNPLFTSPPGCYMHQQANFMTSFFTEANPDISAGEDFNFFGFPDIEQEHAGAIEAGGDLFGMFNDTPQARALMQWLVTPEAQSIWVERGGALSPNKRVEADVYPDELSRLMAEELTSADAVRFDAADLMPNAMSTAFNTAVLDFVNDPSELSGILTRLDQVQTEAYTAATTRR